MDDELEEAGDGGFVRLRGILNETAYCEEGVVRDIVVWVVCVFGVCEVEEDFQEGRKVFGEDVCVVYVWMEVVCEEVDCAA